MLSRLLSGFAQVASAAWPMVKRRHLHLGRDFSPCPAGRVRADGPFSAEAFRDDVLVPALQAGPVDLRLDGTLGLSSAFIEAVFSGLAERLGLDSASLAVRLRVRAELATYELRAERALQT